MRRKRDRNSPGTQQSQRAKSARVRWPQVAVVAGVLILVGLVLLLKSQSADHPLVTASKSLPTGSLIEAEGQAQATAGLDQERGAITPTARPIELPAAQLDRLLAAKQPTLAFFHSNNCKQCLTMMEVVEQVYPEFAGSVALVDVNVYDSRNAGLLQQARIQAIPTQIFIDRMGQGRVVLGAMDPDQLRRELQALVGGP